MMYLIGYDNHKDERPKEIKRVFLGVNLILVSSSSLIEHGIDNMVIKLSSNRTRDMGIHSYPYDRSEGVISIFW